jgi:outer membrane protein insertion porin family
VPPFPLRLWTVSLAVCAALASAVAGAPSTRAQDSPTLVDASTEVRSVRFTFTSTQTFEPEELQPLLATTPPGPFDKGVLGWMRNALSFLPLFQEVPDFPFLPFEMAKDAVRIERFYDRNGFPDADADYFVNFDSTANTVAVLFTVEEGPPLLIERLQFRTPTGQAVETAVPAEARAGWQRFRDGAALDEGSRLAEFALTQLVNQTTAWLKNAGYPFPRVSAETDEDDDANRATVIVRVDLGPQGRFGQIAITGAESVDERVVARELPFETGDRFSNDALVEGQRQVFGLNLFSVALVDAPAPPEGQERDSSVAVRVRVREGPLHLVTAQTGYLSEVGVQVVGEFTHRNFFGGARTLTTGLTLEPGIGAIAAPSGLTPRRYRASVSVRQPYFFNRNLSLTGSPFAELRQDEVENARSFGLSTSLLYEQAATRTFALTHTVALRTLLDAPRANGFLSLLLQNDRDYPFQIRRQTLALTGAFGALDDPLSPSRGFLLRPTLEVAGPSGLTTVQYGRLGASAVGFFPVTERVGLAGRLSAGQLFPFSSRLSADDAYSLARDAVFFAGGTADVRGYGASLLGPKVPDFNVSEDEATGELDVVVPSRGRYTPVGATTKVSGSVQLNLPFPLLPETLGLFGFLDGGVVRSPGDRFSDVFREPVANTPLGTAAADRFADLLAEDERPRYGTGGGISINTPIGQFALGLGYKLNPSYLDERDPNRVLRAYFRGVRGFDLGDGPLTGPVGPSVFDAVEAEGGRRFQLHIAFGQTF